MGDLICVTHWSGYGEIVNTPVVIEEVTDYKDASVEIVARLYRSDIYEDVVNEMSPLYLMPLQTSTGDPNTSGNPPDNTGGTTGTGNSGAGGAGPVVVYPQDGYGTGGGNLPELA